MTYLLENRTRSYAWGSTTVIPELLGVAPTGEPQAELWIGAHRGAPSLARVDGRSVPLDELIDENPIGMLGAGVVARFGPRLPFLLKVLAVERPLSIQAHPTTAQAEAGYDAENAAGVPLDAPNRSYRDRFHKPEMVVAFSAFEALLGFREPAETAAVLGQLGVAGLGDAVHLLTRPDGLAETVRWMLGLDEPAELARDVAAACLARVSSPTFTMLAVIARLHPGDPGLLLALLLEPVRLRPGEACFLPAGTPHAHVRGVAVEVQAASDNTLRAGLTAKHVDVPEVLRVLSYQPGSARAVTPVRMPGGDEYAVRDIDEFRLLRLRLDAEPSTPPGRGPRILLVTDGHAVVSAAGRATELGRGASAFVPDDDGPVELSGGGTVFLATTAVEPPGTAR